MFGLDQKIASLASGKPLVAVAVALLAGLVVFALSTALAMGAVAAGLGRSIRALPARPLGGIVSAFGLWYIAAAAIGAPYPF